MIIVIIPIAIYLAAILIWWLICAISAKNSINSRKRAHFNITEVLDLELMRFWRFFSYCSLAALIIWLVLIGKWYLAFIPLFWNIKVFWFGSLFYLPFNLIESHYLAKVEIVFGHDRAIKISQERNKQVETMKKNNWTIPDKMK